MARPPGWKPAEGRRARPLRAHDLIGCQDIAWDVAGAAIELKLTQGEVDALCGAIENESGHAVSAKLLEFLLPCYVAFQLGAASLAAAALGETEEGARHWRNCDDYARRLGPLLEGEID